MINKYKNSQLNKTSIQQYFIKRFSRIYIVLIPALIFGYILDKFGIDLFIELYNNQFHISSMDYVVTDRLDIVTFLGNIFNTQTIFTNLLGTNAPLWSLANEWWYYILFALLFINNLSRIIFILLFIILFFSNTQILIYSLIWIAGSTLVLFNKHILNWMFSLFLFITVFLISRKLHGIGIDFAIAISLILLLNSFMFIKNFSHIFLENFNDKMAGFSYSLYLFHFPFFVFIISYSYTKELDLLRMQPDAEALIKYMIMIILIYCYSYFMYFIFGKNTHKIQKYLLKKVNCVNS